MPVCLILQHISALIEEHQLKWVLFNPWCPGFWCWCISFWCFTGNYVNVSKNFALIKINRDPTNINKYVLFSLHAAPVSNLLLFSMHVVYDFGCIIISLNTL